jgi:para-nitrobenzyl esterase
MQSRAALLASILFTGCTEMPAAPIDAPSVDAGVGVDAARADAPDAFVWDDVPVLGPDAAFPPDEPPVLTFSDPPVADLPAGVRFAAAVPYGPDPMQVFDVFLPDDPAPTAAVLYIHGGGFVGGSRENAYDGAASQLRAALDAGVAFVSVEYRLLDAPGLESEGVIKPLRDCQRALQFLRHHAAVFEIDPSRIGSLGGSAGAGTSLWLAYHPDMAVPDSADPVARESTRLTAVGVNETQATYDVVRWAPDVFGPDYPFVTNELLRFYGLPAALLDDADALEAELETPYYRAYRAECDLFGLVSADDPPSYFRNSGPDESPLAAGADLLHHPLHARSLYERAMAAGADVEADIQAFDVTSDEESTGFVLSRLE